jgi:hypothetical protein
MLTLGLIAAQMMGGALAWRPVGWITGDAATGKSTLQTLLGHVHGGERGLLQAADATEAGIRSVVGYSSLPVAIDELEPDVDRPQKVRAVIELARRAASGGQIFRGGVDQQGHQSNAVSAFLFTSILIPDMPAQDRSRLILLDLDKPPATAAKPKLDPRRWRAWGAQLRRQLIEGWPTWSDRLEAWREALARHGQTGRGADNYATVLAMADMALHSEIPNDEYLETWAARLGRAVTDEAVEVGSNAEDMLFHLLAQPLDIWRRGRRHTVADWVAFAARLPGAPETMGENSASWQEANGFLAPYGLRVQGKQHEAELQIATAPFKGLLELFEGTPWANGVWRQAAARLPGATRGTTRFNRQASKYWSVPVGQIAGFLHFPQDRVGPDAVAPNQPSPAPHHDEDFA